MVSLALDNKVAVITGGSRGIGAATVRMFCAAGARVLFNYLRARDTAETLARECGTERCVAVQADLSGTASGEALVRAAVERFRRLDILVANHGIWPPEDAPIDRMSDEQWRSTLSINLDSVFSLVKHSVAQMKKQGSGGHIVLVSSTAGQRGEAFHADYAATKGAVISLVKSLATELGPSGIRINAVAPGWVLTDMSRAAIAAGEAAIRNAIPLRRVAEAEDVAGPVVFLASPLARHITGEVLNVNGGSVLAG